MLRSKFEGELTRAKTMGQLGDRPDYWRGYQRGLRRGYYGERFGTAEEHTAWLSLIDDETRRELGQGYRDGLAAANPASAMAMRGRGRKKSYTGAERKRRAQRLRVARQKRWPDAGND